MAKFIDLGVKKADDPIYTEGIGIISISKQPKPPTSLPIQNQESKRKRVPRTRGKIHADRVSTPTGVGASTAGKNPTSKIPSPPPDTSTPTPGFAPKRFKGIDYTQRPQSYWDDSSVLHATLRNVKGENRRRLIRDFHSIDKLDQVEPGLSKDTLTTPERQSLGRIHPSFLGGEYLPDYRTSETEIARIVLDSTTRDVISLRARRTKTGLLRYSIVDEYEGVFYFPKLPSHDPLTLGQIVDWIDQVGLSDGPNLGIGLGLIYTVGNFTEGEDIHKLENFTTVESELYPQLAQHYERLSSEWATATFLESKEGEDRDEIIRCLIKIEWADNETDADAFLKQHGL